MVNTLLDVCAGIGSFSLAAERAGIETVAQIEIDAKRREVLAKYFPDVLRLEDIRDVRAKDIPRPISILAGGTPCQNLSTAGKREGLDGAKSQIWYEYLRLCKELKPQWVVWENVPGALSSERGRDFRTILMGLDELRYHVAWRILDAKYFGVPQRRRRVFLVGHLRDGRAAQVLFESESMSGNSKSRLKAWQAASRVAGTLSKSASGTARTGNGNELDMLVFNGEGRGKFAESAVSSTLRANQWRQTDVDLVMALNPQASITAHSPVRANGIAGTLGTTRIEGVLQNQIVRRLTPRECERLQGYPDDFTAGHSDTARYQMLGDSIAVPCSEWIMKRIQQFS